MDKVETQQSYLCTEHPEFQLEFLQFDNLEYNRKYQRLFYCSDCAYQDSNFKLSNYILIKHIIKSGTDQMLQNWPPVIDNQLHNQLINISKEMKDFQSIVSQIEQFFTDLKTDILKQVDDCKKKMIQQAQDVPYNYTQMLNKYQELSKIQELKSIFVNNQTDIHQKERQYRVLLENILSAKKTITEQLASLLDQYQKEQNIFNSESALFMKESILKSISRSIDIFESNGNKLDVQLITTDFNDGKSYSNIIKNNNNEQQLKIKKQSYLWLNTVSNLILKNDTKYIFRLKIEGMQEYQQLCLGVMQDSNINDKYGCKDKLSCCLEYTNKCLSQTTDYNYGIEKLIKGKEFTLSQENLIEMRVCIKDQILEVYDYPNYYCKLVLADQFKNKLINSKDLRLYLAVRHLNNTVILKEAFTVKNFY